MILTEQTSGFFQIRCNLLGLTNLNQIAMKITISDQEKIKMKIPFSNFLPGQLFLAA